MRRILLACALAVLLAPALAPALASAVTLKNQDGTPTGDPWQAWADQSLAPSPPGDVTFTVGQCPYDERATGCARWYSDGTAEVFVSFKPGARAVELHELGHIYDSRVMNDRAREAWKQATDDERPDWMVPVDGGNRCSDPCEWFAEGYAKCALRGPHIRSAVHGVYAYVMGPIRHRRGCRVIRMAAAGVYGPPDQPQSSGSEITTSRADQSPLVLLLPGGGWQNADPETMRPWLEDFTKHGIRSRAITYPLRDVVGAIEYVRKLASMYPGPVIAYGISAGGTIAAALAATGDVAGAVNIAGPTDFTKWWTPSGITIRRQIGMRTTAQEKAASPFWRLNGRQTPQLIQCGGVDPLVMCDQGADYERKARKEQRDTTLQVMVNAHAQWPQDRDVAREWIARRWPSK